MRKTIIMLCCKLKPRIHYHIFWEPSTQLIPLCTTFFVSQEPLRYSDEAFSQWTKFWLEHFKIKMIPRETYEHRQVVHFSVLSEFTNQDF